MKLWNKLLKVFILFSVLSLLGCLKDQNMQTKEIIILNYRIIPLDVFVKNEDSISVLGYRFSDLDGYAFVPVTLNSNDDGKTWNLKVFPDAKNMPRFFRYSKYIFLYNYEKEKTKASVYISEDFGNSWNLFGEQELLNSEMPIFGNLDEKNPEVHQINKVIADDSWYVEEEPLYTNFIVCKGNPAFTSQVGRINRFDGSSTIIDVKQNLHSTLMFYDEENYWILGKIYRSEPRKASIVLLKSNGNHVEKIGEWRNLSGSKHASDSPKAILVTDEIIAFAVTGPFLSGPTVLRYSIDKGSHWEEIELPTSETVQLSYDDINKKLVVALADQLYFRYIEIAIGSILMR